MEQNANTKGKRTTLKHLKNNRKLKHTWLGSDEEKVVYPPPVEGEDATGSGSEDVMLQPVLCQLTRRPAMRMEPEPVLQAEQCLNYLDCYLGLARRKIHLSRAWTVGEKNQPTT